ncbi:LysE family translocator [Zavarzinia sp. CC-PAN008]|uniref:LysE family translocator n=1 Tax=Zavarzinia sp. CC-PAN008 TaxID=3243332 RepID=UPI003F747DB7
MTLTVYLTFVAAALALILTPGPTTLLAVGHDLNRGRRALWVVPGVMAGDAFAMTMSFLGVGAILATSATLFTILKLAGAAYLIWMAIQSWRAPVAEQQIAVEHGVPGRRMMVQAFVVTALNPKSIIFYVAFMPQFLSPSVPAVPQMLVLGVTMVTLAGLATAAYVLLAGRFRERLASPRFLRWFNRGGAVALFGAGVLTALKRSPA